MKKKNIKKGRLATYTIFGLASVSLIAVGFSAWIVQTDIVETLGNVTVEVADVDNQTVSILEATMTDGTFKLDAAYDDDEGPIVWDETNFEDLSLGFEFQWAINESANFNGIFYRLVETTTGSEQILKAFTEGDYENEKNIDTANLVTFPGKFGSENEKYCIIPEEAIVTDSSTGDSNFAVDSESNPITDYYWKVNVNSITAGTAGEHNVHVELEKGTENFKATVTANFVWGSLFENKNPSLANYDNYTTILGYLGVLEEIKGKTFAFELTHPAN